MAEWMTFLCSGEKHTDVFEIECIFSLGTSTVAYNTTKNKILQPTL